MEPLHDEYISSQQNTEFAAFYIVVFYTRFPQFVWGWGPDTENWVRHRQTMLVLVSRKYRAAGRKLSWIAKGNPNWVRFILSLILIRKLE